MIWIIFGLFGSSLEIQFPAWNKTSDNVNKNEECMILSPKMRGNFGYDHFEHLILYDPRNYSQYCPSNSTTKFTSCWGPYANVKIYNGLRIHADPNIRYRYRLLKHFNSTDIYQEMKMNTQFTGDLFAIPNAYINRWGQTFDQKYRYLSGRCADSDHDKPPYTIESMYQEKKVLVVEDIVLNTVIPWSYAFGHELMEVMEVLFFLKPLLQLHPTIPLVGFEGMVHEKLFPLFEFNNMSIKTLNRFYTLYSRRQIVHAPWIIVPPSPCLFTPPFFPEILRNQIIKQLPFKTNFTFGKNILLHDRRDQQPSRYIPEGTLIETALKQRYAGQREVHLLVGNEPLSETIALMRQTQIFVSVHSSATANMLFMNPGSIYVEISPENHIIECMMQLAIASGVTPYYYQTMPGDWRDIIHVNATDFLQYLFPLIDSLPSQ